MEMHHDVNEKSVVFHELSGLIKNAYINNVYLSRNSIQIRQGSIFFFIVHYKSKGQRSK